MPWSLLSFILVSWVSLVLLSTCEKYCFQVRKSENLFGYFTFSKENEIAIWQACIISYVAFDWYFPSFYYSKLAIMGGHNS